LFFLSSLFIFKIGIKINVFFLNIPLVYGAFFFYYFLLFFRLSSNNNNSYNTGNDKVSTFSLSSDKESSWANYRKALASRAANQPTHRTFFTKRIWLNRWWRDTPAKVFIYTLEKNIYTAGEMKSSVNDDRQSIGNIIVVGKTNLFNPNSLVQLCPYYLLHTSKLVLCPVVTPPLSFIDNLKLSITSIFTWLYVRVSQRWWNHSSKKKKEKLILSFRVSRCQGVMFYLKENNLRYWSVGVCLISFFYLENAFKWSNTCQHNFFVSIYHHSSEECSNDVLSCTVDFFRTGIYFSPSIFYW
jgi:hypothetical protein